MTRSYTHIKQYYEEMEQMHQEGHSCRESGEKFGFTYDNAMAENFFSILKSECIRLYKPETILQAQTLIDSYIAFYNHDRILLNTKLSPIEKRRFFA